MRKPSFRPRQLPLNGIFLGVAFGVALPAGIQAQTHTSPFHVHAQGSSTAELAALQSDLEWAVDRISELLGPFPDTASVHVFPGRESFDTALRQAWGIPETACWMVGAADDHHLYLLSPSVWTEEACEHDPGDTEHRRLLVAHEAVHVYHGQLNPSEDVGLLEEIGWFVEGLATFVSGQLEARHAGRALEAVTVGASPTRLTEAWSGPYRYGVVGSMIHFIHEHWGGEILKQALRTVSQEELLQLLGRTESAFVEEWEAWVHARAASESVHESAGAAAVDGAR